MSVKTLPPQRKTAFAPLENFILFLFFLWTFRIMACIKGLIVGEALIPSGKGVPPIGREATSMPCRKLARGTGHAGDSEEIVAGGSGDPRRKGGNGARRKAVQLRTEKGGRIPFNRQKNLITSKED